MAADVTFDVATDGGNTTATSLTYSHTVAVQSNRYLFVGVVGDTGGDKVTGVTYATVAMTQIGKVLVAAGGSSRDIYLFGLKAPATGANNVVVSASASVFLAAESASYYNVNQASNTPDNSSTGVNASTASFAKALTPVLDRCWVVMFAKNDAGAPSAGAATTLRVSAATGGPGICDTNAVVTPAASTTLTLTQSATAWSAVITSLAPTQGFGRMFEVF